MSSLGDPRLDAVLGHFYSETVGPYWPAERALVDAGYRTIDFPFDEIPPPDLVMEAHWSLTAFLGYVRTWSAVTRFRAERGLDPVDPLADDLRPLWGEDAAPRRVRWPLSLRVGRRSG